MSINWKKYRVDELQVEDSDGNVEVAFTCSREDVKLLKEMIKSFKKSKESKLYKTLNSSSDE